MTGANPPRPTSQAGSPNTARSIVRIQDTARPFRLLGGTLRGASRHGIPDMGPVIRRLLLSNLSRPKTVEFPLLIQHGRAVSSELFALALQFFTRHGRIKRQGHSMRLSTVDGRYTSLSTPLIETSRSPPQLAGSKRDSVDSGRHQTRRHRHLHRRQRVRRQRQQRRISEG